MLLEIDHLQVDFATESGRVRALDGVDLTLSEGETLCLVGESGSGKSITALSIARLAPTPPAIYAGGQILLEGREVLSLGKQDLRKIRGKVVNYIFQEPGASLNPVYRVGTQILEALRLHRPGNASKEEVVRLLKEVRIPDPEVRADAFPHQLSGGMQQRVMIAMALASRPKLLIADEPTTALDVTVQAQIMELLQELKEKEGMSILLITHNLHLVKDIADRIAVMYAGQIVETGPAMELIRKPRHPYTRALLQSTPRLGDQKLRMQSIPGAVPQLGAWPRGCRFHPRCAHAVASCREVEPPMIQIGVNHLAKCPVIPALEEK